MHKCNRADKQPCKSVVWDSYDVPRALCDRCIINGEIIAQKRGLDVGVYARRMGASYQALVDANPAALPTPPPSRSLPRKTAKLYVEPQRIQGTALIFFSLLGKSAQLFRLGLVGCEWQQSNVRALLRGLGIFEMTLVGLWQLQSVTMSIDLRR